jgi:hypothetical protein
MKIYIHIPKAKRKKVRTLWKVGYFLWDTECSTHRLIVRRKRLCRITIHFSCSLFRSSGRVSRDRRAIVSTQRHDSDQERPTWFCNTLQDVVRNAVLHDTQSFSSYIESQL